MQAIGFLIAYILIGYLWTEVLKLEKQLKYLKNRQDMLNALVKAVGEERGFNTEKRTL